MRSWYKRIKFFWDIKKKYKYKNILILGAGPSLNKISEKEIRFLQTELDFCVVALKQAANYYKNYDIAIANECREVEIKKITKDQKLIGISNPRMNLDWDIKLPILTYKWPLTMLKLPLMRFWNPLFNPFRPWGVGVFFELGVFLPVILGSKYFVTVGFDMANTDKNPFNHFYGTKTKEVIDDGVLKEISLIPSATAKIDRFYKSKKIKSCSLTVENAPIEFEKVYNFEDLLSIIQNEV